MHEECATGRNSLLKAGRKGQRLQGQADDPMTAEDLCSVQLAEGAAPCGLRTSSVSREPGKAKH